MNESVDEQIDDLFDRSSWPEERHDLVPAPPSSTAPDADAANRGTEVGPVGDVENEAAQAFDAELEK